MCDICEDEEGRPPVRADPAVVERARVIEARMEGPPASETAWRIFCGREGGSLLWRDHHRILTSYDSALRMMRMATPVRDRRGTGTMRCDFVSIGEDAGVA